MTTITPNVRQITAGLRFPEGPVAMPDGSVILTEIRNRRCSRVTPEALLVLGSPGTSGMRKRA